MCRKYKQDERVSMLLVRETQPHICFYCKKPLQDDEITIDHVLPIARGGQTTEDNLVIACRQCNEEKAELTLEEYIIFLNIKQAIILKFEPIFNNLMQELNYFNQTVVNKNYKYLKKHNVTNIMSNQLNIMNLLKKQRDMIIDNKYHDYIANIRYMLEQEAREKSEIYGIKQLQYPRTTESIKYIYNIRNDKKFKKRAVDTNKLIQEKQYFINNNAISFPIIIDKYNCIQDLESYMRYLILLESGAMLFQQC